MLQNIATRTRPLIYNRTEEESYGDFIFLSDVFLYILFAKRCTPRRGVSLLYIYVSQKEINMHNNSRWHKRNSVICISNQHALPDQCKLCIQYNPISTDRAQKRAFVRNDQVLCPEKKKEKERYTLGV